jgi:DNA-binding GntR family transcriptional regulator
LHERILSGELAEGTPLRQDALASELGVSRIPVREALRQLHAEGLVTFRPYAGAVVSSLSVPEIEELYALRALIESDVLARAIDRLRPEDLDRADEVLAEFDEAFERGDIAVWGTLNWEFHSTLYRVAAQPITMGVLEMLHGQSERYTRAQLALTHWETRAMTEHRRLLELVRDREVEEALDLLREHILSAGSALAAFLRRQRREDGVE